jgi:demethylmenaquinone methyltransferase/2-methoxy-6-polyprenyl-1,4-benzoquinol methylase
MRALQLLALRPGECALEVGTGTGTALPILRQAVGATGGVIGVDLSYAMLGQARRCAAGQSALIQSDVSQLPLADGACSALLACFILEIFPSAESLSVLREWRRILMPGGRLGVSAMSFSARKGWMERLYAWSGRTFPQVVDCQPIDAAALLEQASFSLQTVERWTIWGLPVQVVLATC